MVFVLRFHEEGWWPRGADKRIVIGLSPRAPVAEQQQKGRHLLLGDALQIVNRSALERLRFLLKLFELKQGTTLPTSCLSQLVLQFKVDGTKST